MSPLKGYKQTEEHKRKKLESYKKLPPRSEETRRNMSKAQKGKTPSKETRRKLSKAKTGIPKTEEHKRELFKARRKRPTSLEYAVGILLEEATPGEWEYSGYVKGNQEMGRTPDFVHKKLDKCIEVNSTYFHTTLKGRTKAEEEIWQKKYWMREADYKCLTLWDEEIKNNPDIVKRKIKRFTAY